MVSETVPAFANQYFLDTDKTYEDNYSGKNQFQSLCEMCPNREFFLVRLFPHLD